MLVGEARALAKRAEEARQLVRRAHEGLIGRLTIGFTSSAMYDLLPDLLARFRLSHPDVVVTLREGVLSPDQLRAIDEGEQDLGLLRPPIGNPRIHHLVLRREKLAAVLPAAHPLASQRRIDVRSLAGEDFIMYPQAVGAALNEPILALCRAASFLPNVVQEVGEMQTIARLVAAGLGIALLPASVGILRIDGVALRPLRDRSPLLDLALAWRQDNASAPMRAFIAMARATAPVKQLDALKPIKTRNV